MRVWFVYPITLDTSPGARRVEAFLGELQSVACITRHKAPSSIWGSLKLLVASWREKPDFIVVSMPPYRGWIWTFCCPAKVIYDWRDGWSAAISGGYGGGIRSRPFRAKLARMVENIALFRSRKVITCTPGLYFYLSKLYCSKNGNKVELIYNGHSIDVDGELFSPRSADGRRIAVIAGKFGEYGVGTALSAIKTFLKRYGGSEWVVMFIGADPSKNREIISALEAEGSVSVEAYSRLPYREMSAMLKQADLGVMIARDESYELGTKAFDYIASGLPILDCFKAESPVRSTFKGCLDTDYDPDIALEKARFFSRSVQAKRIRRLLL